MLVGDFVVGVENGLSGIPLAVRIRLLIAIKHVWQRVQDMLENTEGGNTIVMVKKLRLTRQILLWACLWLFMSGFMLIGISPTMAMILEAQDATLTAPMELINDYIWITPGNGELKDPSLPGGTATFTFQIDKAADYYFRIYESSNVAGGGDDSFWVKIDNSEWYLLDTSDSIEWNWIEVTNRIDPDMVGQGETIVTHLAVGEHHIVFKHREDGTILQQIEILETPIQTIILPGLEKKEGVTYITDTETITIGWDASVGATNYEFQVETLFRKPITLYANGNTTELTVPIKRPRTGHFRFMVRACNNGNCSDWAVSDNALHGMVDGENKAWWVYWKPPKVGGVIVE